jgi:hypothetical protein
MKEKPCWKGTTKLLREKATMAKLSERRQRWPSSEERPLPKPRCELNEYIFDNLQFADQTRNFAKKREAMLERDDQAPQREGNYGQALREKATMAKL